MLAPTNLPSGEALQVPHLGSANPAPPRADIVLEEAQVLAALTVLVVLVVSLVSAVPALATRMTVLPPPRPSHL